jgi:hypothetical protein
MQAQEPPRRLWELRFARTTITPRALYASTTVLCEMPCSTSISCLPLAYRRRRQPPSCGDRFSHTHNHTSTPAFSHPLILALCLNHLAGTWRLLLLSRLACSPPLQAPPVQRNTTHTRILLDVRSHGRNQDKPVSLCCIAPTIKRLIVVHLTS